MTIIIRELYDGRQQSGDPEGNNVREGEEAPAEVINPEEGQVFYLTANSASGSKYYGKNGSLGTGWPELCGGAGPEQPDKHHECDSFENEFRVDTYYTDRMIWN